MILDGGGKGGANGDGDDAKKWRKKLKRSMKDSLVNMRSRMADDEAVARAAKARAAREEEVRNGCRSLEVGCVRLGEPRCMLKGRVEENENGGCRGLWLG